MAQIAGQQLMLTWEERKEKAKELIAFLSMWDIKKHEAQNILSIAYGEIKEMNGDQYVATGRGMADFAKILEKGISSDG